MKYVLFAVFEAGSHIDPLLKALHDQGFNGTYLPSASFNTLLQGTPDDVPPVISLSRAIGSEGKDNPAFFSILTDENFAPFRKMVDSYTDNWKKIKGGMFMWPLSFFEGSF